MLFSSQEHQVAHVNVLFPILTYPFYSFIDWYYRVRLFQLFQILVLSFSMITRVPMCGSRTYHMFFAYYVNIIATVYYCIIWYTVS